MRRWKTGKLIIKISMVEVEGKLNQKPISILIDLGDSLSYVSPSLL